MSRMGNFAELPRSPIAAMTAIVADYADPDLFMVSK
jgi:hypothetical protein